MDRIPDWSLLPPDLIRHISGKIPFTNIYFRIRAVCRSWRLACSLHSHHCYTFPWLRLPPDRKKDPTNSTISFYDLSSSKAHQFNYPSNVGFYFCYSSRSWILLVKDMVVSLWNPTTAEMKTNLIPSLATPPTILGFANNEKTKNPLPSIYHQGCGSLYIISKIVLTSGPSDEDCFVVAKFNSEWELGFCKIGDSSWTVLKLTEYGHGSRRILDFKCKKNLVYAINNIGHVTIYDLQNLSQNILIADLDCSHNYCKVYLVVGIEGELKGVPIAVKEVEYIIPKGRIEVYKCIYDELCREHRWVRVKDIGNAILFFDRENCRIVSLDSFRLNGLEKNHICFCKSGYNVPMEYYSLRIEMMSIENGSIKEVPSSLGFTRIMLALRCEYLNLLFV